MTPEREAEIRKESTVRADDCGRYARELLEALDELRGKVERFKVALHSLSTRSLAPDRLADEVGGDPDEVSSYVLGRVGGMGSACGLWAKRDFPEFFATEESE